MRLKAEAAGHLIGHLVGEVAAEPAVEKAPHPLGLAACGGGDQRQGDGPGRNRVLIEAAHRAVEAVSLVAAGQDRGSGVMIGAPGLSCIVRLRSDSLISAPKCREIAAISLP
jgi:hypothetical protein